MSTKPDDTTLTLWLDDELKGEELAAVEAWAKDHPDQLAARDEIRRWRQMVSASVPAVEEPPAPEIFNERISRAIHDEHGLTTEHQAPKNIISWRTALMPLAACAGMVFAFWIGANNAPTGKPTTAGKPTSNSYYQPTVYTPETGVNAEWFTSAEASATVIVLDGVDAIPDSLDFSATASTQRWEEIDSTAESNPSN